MNFLCMYFLALSFSAPGCADANIDGATTPAASVDEERPANSDATPAVQVLRNRAQFASYSGGRTRYAAPVDSYAAPSVSYASPTFVGSSARRALSARTLVNRSRSGND